jgi:hypothetical protein
MYFVNSYFTVAVYLTVLFGAILAVLHWRNSRAVTSRIQRMMLCCGIYEEADVRAEQLRKLDMDAVRSRCRHCAVTDLCDRWLDGESIGSNKFCPNSWHFIEAANSSKPAEDSGYMSRWIAEPQ